MSVAIKERGILFKAPMVRAILEGRKTQTRRIMKPQYDGDALCSPRWFHTTKEDTHGQLTDGDLIFGTFDDNGEFGARFPYGAIGDRLWVRETWCHAADDDDRMKYNADGNLDSSCCHYRAGGLDVVHVDGAETKSGLPKSPWVPSIFMPRWASRITLEITNVRVERLNDITEEDAADEGIKFDTSLMGYWEGYNTAREAFAKLWESINGAGSWSANPWLWVIEFQRVQSCKAK